MEKRRSDDGSTSPKAQGRESRGLRALEFDPDAAAGLAFLQIQRVLFDALRHHEHGVREDRGVESLHQFRIAIRRSRVLHRLYRKRLRGGAFMELSKELAWLGQVTGPARDLDVHVANVVELQRGESASIEREQVAVDSCQDEDLEPLVSRLRERRQAAWDELVHTLSSKRYTTFVERSGAFLRATSRAAAATVDSGPPLRVWASRRIARSFSRMRKRGRRLDAGSSAKDLHQLRIDGKRLRYTLEFFRSLYSADEVRRLLKPLRRLQQTLGHVNDACVQQTMLRELAHDLDRAGRADPDLLILIGQLIEREIQRGVEERLAFEDRFSRFDRTDNRKRVRDLFE